MEETINENLVEINDSSTKLSDINTETFKVGDKVTPTVLVSYSGAPLKQYDAYYIITNISDNRATLMARGQIWAVMDTSNLRHYPYSIR